MRIGVIRYWPNRPAAEHETIERFKAAAQTFGHSIVEIADSGMTLQTDTVPEVDFIINLHFQSAKAVDVLYYGALWNPLAYYHAWGFQQYWANQMSNDFLLSCGSRKLDDYAHNFRTDLQSFPILNHTVPENYLQPEISKMRKLFYIGINWERSTAKHGRHHLLLKQLDDAGVLDIYGPKKLDGVHPWRDYKCYRGELPFDGKSIFEAAHKSGAALVLSSEEHIEDEIMTSRIFESIAAGIPFIADQHPFIKKFFGESASFFDSREAIADQVSNILRSLEKINTDSQETYDKILNSQKKLRENFSLDRQLNELTLNHARNVLENSIKSEVVRNRIHVIVNTLSSFESNKSQKYALMDFLSKQLNQGVIHGVDVITESKSVELKEKALKLGFHYAQQEGNWKDRLGRRISETNSDWLLVLTGEELLFQDFFNELHISINNNSENRLIFLTSSFLNENSRTYLAVSPLVSDWQSTAPANFAISCKFIHSLRNELEYSDMFTFITLGYMIDPQKLDAGIIYKSISCTKDENSKLGSLLGREVNTMMTEIRALILTKTIGNYVRYVLNSWREINLNSEKSSQLKFFNKRNVLRYFGDRIRKSRLPNWCIKLVIRVGKSLFI
jgi:hypothetical protein